MSTAPRTSGSCWNPWSPAIVRENCARYFRADAAVAKPEIYEFLEAEGYAYAVRLPTNTVLQGKNRTC
jgi:hypothetical protein